MEICHQWWPQLPITNYGTSSSLLTWNLNTSGMALCATLDRCSVATRKEKKKAALQYILSEIPEVLMWKSNLRWTLESGCLPILFFKIIKYDSIFIQLYIHHYLQRLAATYRSALWARFRGFCCENLSDEHLNLVFIRKKRFSAIQKRDSRLVQGQAGMADGVGQTNRVPKSFSALFLLQATLRCHERRQYFPIDDGMTLFN